VWVTSEFDSDRQFRGRAARARRGNAILHRQTLQQELGGVTDQFLGQRVLLVVLGVHEHKVGAVAVQIRGVAAVDGGGLDLLRPALYVLSTTLPDNTFLSLVRTKAGPLPGLTCWELG